MTKQMTFRISEEGYYRIQQIADAEHEGNKTRLIQQVIKDFLADDAQQVAEQSVIVEKLDVLIGLLELLNSK